MAAIQMFNNNKPPKPKLGTSSTSKSLVCFSFAAYAKSLIENLKSSNITVVDGLSDGEFFSIESLFSFSFPPDLRSILREGLPIGSGFPNWRSSSVQQLRILINLPILSLLKQVSVRRFWIDSWGNFPDDINLALEKAKQFLNKAPVLVPIYRNYYIPCSPSAAGNPIFLVDGENVRLLSYDITGFFQEFEFLNVGALRPVWAAKEARRVEFWTEATERRGGAAAARGETRGWWSGDLGGCLEDVFWRLREGGWKEEEVREMMMMDGCDEAVKGEGSEIEEMGDRESVTWHVRMLSLVLLRAGWSREDVMDSLGLQNEDQIVVVFDGEKTDKEERSSIKQLMHLQSFDL
ncbi:hypothetical protein UlMin_038957 [Ulmus minor]